MTLIDIYLIVILPNIGRAFEAVGIAGTIMVGATGGFLYIFGKMESDETLSMMGKKSLKITILCACIGILSTFIPSSKQMYTIVGGYVATNIEGVEELPDNIVGAVNTWLKEIKPEEKD